ncbi:MetQ/NlpA family ABC transporter substrate-binding protein [Cryobacterium adonitolivorans]|uniref:MetQ/NlpA family ABC transporter substrate-binding protein n=1 Tax=Cryobacterium adonitolivorans TaxID=1259189 RepID=UPI001F547566|nr:MetQ/NlpA family ABC transporter substrate-binding protein [Cryobacterium adonitolivorans]
MKNSSLKNSSLKKSLLAALALGASVTLLAGCAGGAGGDDETVKIGVVGASDPYWADYTEAAAEEGITVEVVDFADYNQPNPALTNGDIDINQFQHLVYLADYNVSSGEDLTPVGATAIYPLGLYSTKVTDVADLGKGDTVAVPNDASNLARALLVLQSADLLTLKDGGTIFSTLDDVDTEKSLVTVTALEPSLTATSLPDVDAAIINNDFVEKAGLKFEDALIKDDPSDESALPYVNVFAVRAEDKDNETYAKLVDIFQTTTAVTDGLLEVSGNSAVLATTPPADLQSALATVEKDTAAQK